MSYLVIVPPGGPGVALGSPGGGGGGGGGAPSGPAGGVLSGTYPDPAFAVDMATQAELDAAVFSSGGGSPQFRTADLQMFVDYQNGVDANNGLSTSTAKKTIQAAYNALKTRAETSYLDVPSGSILGVGQINLTPGYHDLAGTPLTIVGNRPCRLVGNRLGAVNHYVASSAATIVSSANLAHFVRIDGSSAKGQGHTFEHVNFQVSPTANASTTKVIWITTCGHILVERCSFDTTTNATNLACVAVYQDDLVSSAGEAGWFRVLYNDCANMALYKAATTTGAAGGNFNRGLIMGNVVFFNGTGSLAAVGFYAHSHVCTVAFNNFEGPAVGAEFASPGQHFQNMLLNNAGEDQVSTGTPANAFYNLSGTCGGFQIIGGECPTNSATGPGTFVNFGANAFPNKVDMSDASLVGVTSKKTKIVNGATYPTRNVIYNKDGRLYPYRSGAGASWGSADWPQVPDDGTVVGIATDTNNGVTSVFFSGAGALHQVEESVVMTATQRKFTSSDSVAGSTTFSPATTLQAGKLAVLAITLNAGKTVTGVTDSKGNTWTVDSTQTDTVRTVVFVSSQIGTAVGTGDTITATFSTSTASGLALWLWEVANAAPSAAFDKAAVGTGTGTTMVTASSGTLAASQETVIAVCRSSAGTNAFTKGASYVAANPFQTGDTNAACCEFKRVRATSAVTADCTNTTSGSWIIALATYKGL